MPARHGRRRPRGAGAGPARPALVRSGRIIHSAPAGRAPPPPPRAGTCERTPQRPGDRRLRIGRRVGGLRGAGLGLRQDASEIEARPALTARSLPRVRRAAGPRRALRRAGAPARARPGHGQDPHDQRGTALEFRRRARLERRRDAPRGLRGRRSPCGRHGPRLPRSAHRGRDSRALALVRLGRAGRRGGRPLPRWRAGAPLARPARAGARQVGLVAGRATARSHPPAVRSHRRRRRAGRAVRSGDTAARR